ncbi:hypothetical protein MAR_032730 [Mya arenaria]|uniref:Uncharacterized protein n=1 Tax=Mya arenaria TaxID=6604 RepID=A0ABY7FB06_MYAAR|nr:hypothetical protein MAR_032730 [Mya arenaria]
MHSSERFEVYHSYTKNISGKPSTAEDYTCSEVVLPLLKLASSAEHEDGSGATNLHPSPGPAWHFRQRMLKNRYI